MDSRNPTPFFNPSKATHVLPRSDLAGRTNPLMADSIRQGGGHCWRTVRPSVRPSDKVSWVSESECCGRGLEPRACRDSSRPCYVSHYHGHDAPDLVPVRTDYHHPGVVWCYCCRFGFVSLLCFPLPQTRGWTTLSLSARCVLQLNQSWHQRVLAYWHCVCYYWLSAFC